MKKAWLFIAIVSCFSISRSQESMVDSAIAIPYIGISYGFHLPTGDLGDRFGLIQSVGGQFGLKFKSNIHLSFKMDYLFGNQVKEDDILDNIKTSEGGIIEIGGQLTTPIFEMQGYTLSIMGGYVFPFLGPNVNSGILVSAGPCFLQHKIKVDYRDAQIPQLEGEYEKGYDRLTNGYGINEFIGYIFYGKKKLVNFYVGFDFMQTWTTNRRGFNYDKMESDNAMRQDFTSGFRMGWMLTLYRRQPEKFYYR